MQELHPTTIQAWRKFLSSEAGVKGLLWWREQAPSVRKDNNSEHGLVFDAGVAEGYRRCLDNLSGVLGAKEEQQSESLDN